MKNTIILVLSFFIGLLYIISSCGTPNETISTFKIVATLSCPGFAQNVRIDSLNHKLYAFVASGQAGMVIYNVDEPESSYQVAQWMDTINSCWAIATHKNKAYLAYGSKELEIIDIRNLDSLKFLGGFVWPVAYAYDIFVSDTNFAYLAAKQQFIITDISDPTFPNVIYQQQLTSNARSVFVKDSFAYIACEQLGVVVINVKAPPYTIKRIIDTPGNARSVFISDNTCYVADGRDGLVLIDISNPHNPTIISHLTLSGYTNHVFTKDTLAYIACEAAGVSIVNIQDKAHPFLIETIKTTYAKSVYVPDGHYVYVADRDDGLVIIKQEE